MNKIDILPSKLLYFNRIQFVNETADDSGYGRFIFKQVEQWATLMEQKLKVLLEDEAYTEIEEWKTIVEWMEGYARETSLETQCTKDGLTGFQQDCATVMLINSWRYGFQLRMGLILEKAELGYTLTEEQTKDYIEYKKHNYIDLIEKQEQIQSEIW